MSTTPKITMIGLYNWDNKLFDEMTLPPEIEKDVFINSFLLNYGEYPVVYANWDIMKFAIGVWSKKWYHSIERIVRAMLEDYDPLHNYDRHELYTDTENKTGETSGKSNTKGSLKDDLNTTASENVSTESESSGSMDGSTSNEHEVSAFNEDNYQPDNKDTGANTQYTSNDVTEDMTRSFKEGRARTGSNTVDETTSGNSSEDRQLTHEGHLYGNIGVTKSTEMLLEEKNLRASNNIIDIVAEMLFKEVCIFVI